MQTQTDQSNLSAIGLVLLAVIFLSSMDGAMKNLVQHGFSVIQLLAMRSWIVLPILLVWMAHAGGLSALKTRHKGLHFARVVAGFGAPFFFFNALGHLPLADATVIFFGATFIMTALSVPMLGERVGPHRWSAIGVGFSGILIAANPSGDVFNIGALYAFGASLSYSLLMLLARKMGPEEGTFKLVFFFHVWIALVSNVLVFSGIGGLDFIPMSLTPSMHGFGGVVVVSLLVIGGHSLLMRGFSSGPIGLLAPFEYSALLWSALIGYLIWGDIPGLNFWGGAVLVVASGIYLVHRETRLRKEGRAVAAAALVEAGPLPAPLPTSVSLPRD